MFDSFPILVITRSMESKNVVVALGDEGHDCSHLTVDGKRRALFMMALVVGQQSCIEPFQVIQCHRIFRKQFSVEGQEGTCDKSVIACHQKNFLISIRRQNLYNLFASLRPMLSL
jgi:hypothetical protein